MVDTTCNFGGIAKLITHHVSLQFTFAKIWLLCAQFEIRQKNLQGARKVMVRTEELVLFLWSNTEKGNRNKLPPNNPLLWHFST